MVKSLDSPITWMVLVRDVSHAVKVKGEDVVIAAIVLDVDTGLVRGLTVAPTEQQALAQSFRMALEKPAGTLPPGRPERVIAPVGMGALVKKELHRIASIRPTPPVVEAHPGNEAEDIFDSFVGHMSGREQSADPPSPEEWQLLFAQTQAYCQAAPWLRWSDEMDLTIEIDIDGESSTHTAVVMGNAEMQYGLALYPGEAIRADFENWKPPAPWPIAPGTLACSLDRRGEAPAEIDARASRYGWPEEAELVPTFFGLDSDSGRELSSDEAVLLAVATAAVVAHDERGLVSAEHVGDPMTGFLVVSGNRKASFSIHADPTQRKT